MKQIIVLFFVVILILSVTAEDNDQIVRMHRDGNVMKTGCQELDTFLDNLSNFSKKIVALFYNDNSKDTNANSENSKVDEDNEINSGGNNQNENDNNGHATQELESSRNVKDIQGRNRDNIGDLIHMDLLPIN